MARALAGHENVPFQAPDGISFVDIDPDTGKLALPTCPHVTREAFIAGTEPLQACELHRY
jgi:membrane carboxypeptidase/penicillin-binding protein